MTPGDGGGMRWINWHIRITGMNLPSTFSMLSKKQKPLKTLMVSAVRPSTPPCYSPEAGGLCCLKHKKTKKKPLSCFYQTFHVLHRGVQKTLLPHVPDSEQAGAAEAMVFSPPQRIFQLSLFSSYYYSSIHSCTRCITRWKSIVLTAFQAVKGIHPVKIEIELLLQDLVWAFKMSDAAYVLIVWK